MEAVRSLICIICPVGCKLNITVTENGSLAIAGNCCEHGKMYAEEETLKPVRMLTTTIWIKNGETERVPVRTNKALPKKEIPEYMQRIKKLQIEAPVKVGEVLARDLFDSDVCLIATKNVARRNDSEGRFW